MARWCNVTKRFTFEAAHRLPSHFGKCSRPHGHSYKLEVEIRGKIQEADPAAPSSDGMILDFYHLGTYVKQVIIETFDHQDLNQVLPEQFHPTTAENLAWFIMHALWKGLTTDEYSIYSVKLWETADGCVKVFGKDYEEADWPDQITTAADAARAISGT